MNDFVFSRYWIINFGSQIVLVHKLPRCTNNNIQSFHCALRLKFSVAHDSLWVFLSKIMLKCTEQITYAKENNIFYGDVKFFRKLIHTYTKTK
jgi:hypothetical protein